MEKVCPLCGSRVHACRIKKGRRIKMRVKLSQDQFRKLAMFYRSKGVLIRRIVGGKIYLEKVK